MQLPRPVEAFPLRGERSPPRDAYKIEPGERGVNGARRYPPGQRTRLIGLSPNGDRPMRRAPAYGADLR
jgi:hypothetical protein